MWHVSGYKAPEIVTAHRLTISPNPIKLFFIKSILCLLGTMDNDFSIRF